MRDAITSVPDKSSWRGAQLLTYTDKFNFTSAFRSFILVFLPAFLVKRFPFIRFQSSFPGPDNLSDTDMLSSRRGLNVPDNPVRLIPATLQEQRQFRENPIERRVMCCQSPRGSLMGLLLNSITGYDSTSPAGTSPEHVKVKYMSPLEGHRLKCVTALGKAFMRLLWFSITR